jgi:hypothetical protein
MRLLATAALLLLSGGAQAKWYVSVDAEKFAWEESSSPSVTEKGPRYGLSWGYLRERDAGWQFAYRGQFRGGTVDYTGALLFTGEPATARTRYTGLVNEVQAIYRIPQSEGVEFVAGLGFDYWERNILPDQKEDYSVVFARLGLNIDTRASRTLFGGAGLKLPFHVSENAHLDQSGFDHNERLHPVGQLSVYAQVGYRFTQSWSLIGYYDGYRFGESNRVPVTSPAFPGTQFVVFQPASSVDSLGLKLQYEFR